ncbi:PA2169 family four-helix-bundle protein [Luteibacter jiangsuensis]|uniref:PA2169 family four-helix-bundle protein n=1 Tax=Luteibacter jiangsuensis TaxID=637577 RepID=A0ABX0Q3H2_9GAMM|nr:PA2169 family four-helix-bundle protein [Luteibacter jiangsuensis]NID04292.1 PA2169 family four-helix-bundle protein [Luteibacter jiangsuensis]
MTSSTEHDIKVLNTLIETTIDSAEGYGEAAKDAENTRYAAAFQQRAAERRQVAQRLQQQVRSLGGTPEDDGTILAKAHRMFVELRAKMSSNDDTAIVDEVERGEDHIKAKYEDALKDSDVSAGTMSAINQAYVSVKTGHDQMRDLKHALHAKS